jgi:hypothetical protein
MLLGKERTRGEPETSERLRPDNQWLDSSPAVPGTVQPVVQRISSSATHLVKQQRNRRIIRSDGGQKQIAGTQTRSAKSVPNLKADLDGWPACVECREKRAFNPERPPPQLGRGLRRGRTSGMCGLERLSAWQFVETVRATSSDRL